MFCQSTRLTFRPRLDLHALECRVVPDATAYAFPNLDTTTGALTAVILAETRMPEGPGTVPYDLGQVTVAMRGVRAVVGNRLARNDLDWGRGPNGLGSEFDAIGTPSQFAGFDRTATGVSVSAGIRANIQTLVNIANNDADTRQPAARAHLDTAAAIAAGPVNDPFTLQGGTYANRTAGAGGPSLFWKTELLASVQGTNLYTLAGVDVVFVIDSTGSMSDDIAAVQREATTFINKLFRGEEASEHKVINNRVGVVTYKDPGDVSTAVALTADRAAALAGIRGIGTGGGGDTPEGVYSGTLAAVNGGAGDWRALPMRRRIIVIGDAEAKDGELRAEVERLRAAQTTIEYRVPESGGGPNPTPTPTPTASATGTVTLPVDRFRVFTIAVGDDEDAVADFAELAAAGGGQAFRAADADALLDVLLRTVDTAVGGSTLSREVAVGGAAARLLGPDASPRITASPFAGGGGVRVAAADFTGDGVADLVVGTAPGTPARVVVLDGTDGRELFSVSPFETSFTGGVFVAAGDITGDGRAELVVSPDTGGGPRVRVYSGGDFLPLADFLGIDDARYRGGARAAVGDINGDGYGDLVVAAGEGGGPRVAMFDGRTISGGVPVRLAGDFFAFEAALRNGVYVAVGDLDGDGLAEVVAGGGPGGGPRVTAFGAAELLAGRLTPTVNFFGGDAANRGGVRVAVKNLDDDGRGDLVTGSGAGGGSRVTAYRGLDLGVGGTPPALFAFDAEPGSLGGVFVG